MAKECCRRIRLLEGGFGRASARSAFPKLLKGHNSSSANQDDCSVWAAATNTTSPLVPMGTALGGFGVQLRPPISWAAQLFSHGAGKGGGGLIAAVLYLDQHSPAKHRSYSITFL